MYYRCHTKECPTTTVREERVDDALARSFEPLYFDAEEQSILTEVLTEMKADFMAKWEAETNAMRLQGTQIKERLDRLTDAYIDQLIDRQTFEARKTSLLMEEKSLQEKIGKPKQAVLVRLTRFLELAGDTSLLYKTTLAEEKRGLVRIATSNRQVDNKNVVITLNPAFQEVANRYDLSNSRPSQDRHRTLEVMLLRLVDWFTANPEVEFDDFPRLLNQYTDSNDQRKVDDSAA